MGRLVGNVFTSAIPAWGWLKFYYDACLWECRGRQPFAGARGVLASSFLPAAAGGQYHLNKEKFAKGGIRMILEKRKIFDGQKDMISTLDLETRARPFDDARVEAQSALRQQPITPAEVLDQARREVGVAGDGQPRRQEQGIGDHFDGG